jgi:hypothetical protein
MSKFWDYWTTEMSSDEKFGFGAFSAMVVIFGAVTIGISFDKYNSREENILKQQVLLEKAKQETLKLQLRSQ